MAPTGPSSPIARLGELVEAQLEHWAPAPLHTASSAHPRLDDPRLSRLTPELLAHLDAHRAALVPWIRETCDRAAGPDRSWATSPHGFLRDRLVRWLWLRQQFLELDEPVQARLEQLLARALLAAADALEQGEKDLGSALAPVIADGRRQLHAVLSELGRGDPSTWREVVCSEHDPELQLAVLGLERVRLPEPILDLGCGPSAALVRALRTRGLHATGLDRHAEAEDVIEGDWLRTPLEPEAWGTIVSHLGFSHHFLHQHLASDEGAERYARRTMEILRALKAGGVFAYAPGLPFFEPLLQRAGYGLVRVPLSEPVREALAQSLSAAIGEDVAYACQVWRR